MEVRRPKDAAEFCAAFGISASDLMGVADKYRARAYAPYSNFYVGAAILLDGGGIVGGCNVENASYGVSICAERVAMSAAVAEGKRRPLAVAVSGMPGVFCPPCGTCRQFLSEFNPNLSIVLMNGAEIELFCLDSLLPLSFKLNDGKDA
jgi:cytidine deaminase